MHIETYRFPPPHDSCSSGTTKSGIVCLRRYDVPAHRQDRVDPLHSFNPFILFTGPAEVCGTHRCLNGPGAPFLARRMGHSDPAMTLRLYGHLFEGTQVQLSEKIDELRAATEPKAGTIVPLARVKSTGWP